MTQPELNNFHMKRISEKIEIDDDDKNKINLYILFRLGIEVRKLTKFIL